MICSLTSFISYLNYTIFSIFFYVNSCKINSITSGANNSKKSKNKINFGYVIGWANTTADYPAFYLSLSLSLDLIAWVKEISTMKGTNKVIVTGTCTNQIIFYLLFRAKKDDKFG